MDTKDKFICDNIFINSQGHLTFAGQDTVTLAGQYGTPLYLMDEERIRLNCRTYTEAFRKHFRTGSLPLYASKANAFKQIYRIIKDEGMGIDVVSCGEIYTAMHAGFPLENAFFHGNNKTDEDITYAIDCGIGYFVADNMEEIKAIEEKAAARGIKQKILLRLTPGIDPHTYAAVNTGKVDSKFGVAIETGQAEESALYALAQPHINLMGFHCHVGSQVFAENVFERAAVIMLEFIAMMHEKHGYMAHLLNLGGGYGVRYTAENANINVTQKIAEVAAVINAECERLHIPIPAVMMEPGRSIVADAGMTLYTVGSVKTIPGYRTYVSIDGGMTDNPRFALYGSRYTCLTANKMNEETTLICSLSGRCCESGDMIQENVLFPANISRGDIIAVCTTGAYNYAMASNYNRIPRPPVVMLRGDESYIAVRRETPENLANLDI